MGYFYLEQCIMRQISMYNILKIAYKLTKANAYKKITQINTGTFLELIVSTKPSVRESEWHFSRFFFKDMSGMARKNIFISMVI